jgi:hypothetical protein
MATIEKWPDKQWYQVYIVVDGKEHSLGATQSRYLARKDAKEMNGRVRKIPTPKAVIK